MVITQNIARLIFFYKEKKKSVGGGGGTIHHFHCLLSMSFLLFLKEKNILLL
jgi:hypothetical protein